MDDGFDDLKILVKKLISAGLLILSVACSNFHPFLEALPVVLDIQDVVQAEAVLHGYLIF